MVIIKNGNWDKIKKTARFKCWYCDCIYEAGEDEYHTIERTEYDGRRPFPEIFTIPVYQLDCPCCGKTNETYSRYEEH